MEKAERNWLIILLLIAFVFNATTLIAVPWAQSLFNPPEPKQVIHIHIDNYTFYLPSNPIVVKVNEPIKFVITSGDVTYGFGVFKSDGTMVFQIQVLPKYNNTITWTFDEVGNYTIRSTEYSGPEHPKMVIYDAIEVVN